MNLELKEYLDAWEARRQRDFDNLMALMDALPSPADHNNSTPAVTADGVVGPVPASSGTAELVTAAARLAEPPATIPIVEESAGIAPAVPNVTSTVAPANCSTECAAQTATESTHALTSAAAPTSPTTTLVDVPMLAATAASEGTLNSDTTTTPLLQASGSSSTTEVGVVLPAASVCIPWASTRPWLEPVPPRPPDPGRKLQSHLQALVALPLASSELCLISGGWGNHATLNLDTICNIIPTTDTPWSCKDGVPVEDNVRDDPLEAGNEEAAAVDLAAEHVISGLSNEGFNMLFVQAGGEEHDLQVLAWPTSLHFLGCMMASIFTRRILPADVHIGLSEFTTGLSVLGIQLFEAVRWAVEDATIHAMSIGRFVGQEPFSFVIDSQVLPLHLTTLMNTVLEVHTVAAPKAGPTISEREFELLPLSSLDMQYLGFMSVDEEDAMGNNSSRVDGLMDLQRAKNMLKLELDQRLIDLQTADATEKLKEASRFYVQVPSISTPREKPFGPSNVSDEVIELPQMPDSASSVLLPRRKLFDNHDSQLQETWTPRLYTPETQLRKHANLYERNSTNPHLNGLTSEKGEISGEDALGSYSDSDAEEQGKDGKLSGSQEAHMGEEIKIVSTASSGADVLKVDNGRHEDNKNSDFSINSFPIMKNGPGTSEVKDSVHAGCEQSTLCCLSKANNSEQHVEEANSIDEVNSLFRCRMEKVLVQSISEPVIGQPLTVKLDDKSSNPQLSSDSVPIQEKPGEVFPAVGEHSPELPIGDGDRELLTVKIMLVWHHVKYTQWAWDPRGCTFALCGSKKKWTTLHCYEQFQWSSLRLACAFRIWLVAWIVDGLELSTCRGQAHFQGGRDVLRADFSDQDHVSRDYYITFVNQIPIGYDYYLNPTNYFDTVCSDIIYYREDYHDNSIKTKKLHMPWDPGKSVRRYPLKFRLGDKPSFKEGGMLGPVPTSTRTWASLLGHHTSPANVATFRLHIHQERQRPDYPEVGSGKAPATPSSHLALFFHSPSCLFILYLN